MCEKQSIVPKLWYYIMTVFISLVMHSSMEYYCDSTKLSCHSSGYLLKFHPVRSLNPQQIPTSNTHTRPHSECWHGFLLRNPARTQTCLLNTPMSLGHLHCSTKGAPCRIASSGSGRSRAPRHRPGRLDARAEQRHKTGWHSRQAQQEERSQRYG